MTGLAEVLAAARRSVASARPAVLATVVSVEGSAYRRPGARMLIAAGAEPVGLVSGGCLEADLNERATAVLQSGEPHTVVYDMRSPDDLIWGLGLGCNGEVRVLLERLGPESGDHLEFIAGCLERRLPGVLVTQFEGADVGRRWMLTSDVSWAEGANEPPSLEPAARRALGAGRSRILREGGFAALVEYIAPPLKLLVFGTGADTGPVIRLAEELGWQVQPVDPRVTEPAPLSIDARSAILLMTHHFLDDLELLKRLIDSPAFYVGLLGPRQRAENLLSELVKAGWPPDDRQLSRLHGPVGLDIGSETPEEIALSALAEIQAVLAGRGGGFLRERRGPLHDWADG